jgi:hypothetical protein
LSLSRIKRETYVNNNLQKDGAVVVNELLDGLLQVLNLVTAHSLDVHSIGQLDEVGVGLVSPGETVLVEERLPLGNHSLLLVVQDNDLDTNVELGNGGKLLKRHVEGSVSVNVDNDSVRAGNLGSNGGRKTESHGSKTTGGDHGTGVSPAEVLSSPHLVLSDTGGNDDVLLAVGGLVGDLLNDGLGLDHGTGGLALVVEGVALLPVGDLGEPLRAGLDSFDVGEEESQVVGNISLNGLGSLDDLVDVLGHDLEVDNSSTSLSGGSLGGRSELGDVSGDTVIETGSKSEDQVGLLHGQVGVSGSVHSQHVKGLLVQLIESTKSLKGGGDGDLGLLGELLQELRSDGTLNDTLSSVDDGLLGLGQKVGNALDGVVKVLLVQLLGSEGSSRGVGGELGLEGDGVTEDGSGDILGQVDENGSGTSSGSNLESLVNSSGKLSDVLNHDVPLGAGTGDSDNVGLLEGIGSDSGGGDLSTEDNEGGSVGQGILEGGDNIGGTRSGGDEDDTRLSGGTGVTLGHVSSTLLVSGKNELKVLRVVDGIKNRENSSSRVSNCLRMSHISNIWSWGIRTDVLHVMSQHHLVEDLSSGHSNHAIIALV